MELLFNILTIASALGVVLSAIQVKRLNKYISSPAWTFKIWAWILFGLSQISSLINVNLLGAGLNWLSLVNRIATLVGIGLMVVSYIKMETMFDRILKRMRKSVIVDKPVG